MKQKLDNIEFEISSGNIFKDLGIKDADELLIKSRLALKIAKIIKMKKFTQKTSATIMGISQDKISNIIRGNLSRVSEKKLMECLTKLGFDIEIKVKQSNTAIGHVMMS